MLEIKYWSVFFVATLILVGCASNESQDDIGKDSAGMSEDLTFCNDTFTAVLKHHGDKFDPSTASIPHRTVACVMHAHGIIGNGGFRFLFEGDFPGDPSYKLTRQAYSDIGAQQAVEAFNEAFSAFPNGEPPQKLEERERLFLAKYPGFLTPVDKKYLSASHDIEAKLAAYIRANESAFKSLR